MIMNKNNTLIIALFSILSLALLHSTSALAEQFDIVTKLKNTQSSTVWRIDKPNVKRSLTEYRQIQFKTGDQVTIEAGGCVQTGGHGKTWKRYLDPLGSNADEQYSAMINIPGVTNGRRRLQMWVNRPFVVTQPATLELGYQDDNYSDNGYWGHDDGTGDQCRNIGPAWVVITIKSGSAVPAVKVPRYNEVYQKSSHNAYESPKPSLGVQLQDYKIRSLEIDLQAGHGPGSTQYRGDWYVYHKYLVAMGTSCDKLSTCLDQLRSWHTTRPNHEVVTVFLDLKDNWDDAHGQGPGDLDRTILEHLPGAVYTVADLVRSCSNSSANMTARDAIHNCGWPTLPSMRNKFIFALTGDTGQLNKYAGDPSNAVHRVAFIAPEISSAQEINNFRNAVFFNLNSDNFTVGRAVFSAGYVSRVYYYNTALDVHGINDSNNWGIAVNNSIHHIATDELDPNQHRWTITYNAKGWPFACMLQDCSNMEEPGYHSLTPASGQEEDHAGGGKPPSQPSTRTYQK
jgi:hypothetical protein